MVKKKVAKEIVAVLKVGRKRTNILDNNFFKKITEEDKKIKFLKGKRI